MKKRWIPLVAFAGSLLIAGGIAFSKRHALSSAIKDWRSEQLLASAVEAKKSGDFTEAQRFALAAYQLDARNIEPLRILLATGDPKSTNELLKIANAVFFHPGAEVKDRAKCLSIYLANRDFRLFAKYFEALPEDEKNHPDVLYLHAGYFAAQGGAASAIEILEQGPKEEVRFAMMRTSLLAVSGDEEQRRAGQEALSEFITSGKEAIADHAFRLISTIPPSIRMIDILKPPAEEWYTDRDESQLLIQDHLVMATFAWMDADSAKKGERNQLIQDTISKHGAAHPVAMADWLMSLKLRERALTVASKAYTKLSDEVTDRDKKKALFEIQLRALRALSRWEEQLELLQSPPDGLPPLSLALARANAATQLGKRAEASEHWKEAWRHAELASVRRNSYMDIYQWARQTNETDQAVRALVEAGKSKLGILPPTDELTDFMIFLAENDRGDDLVALTDSFFWREAFSPPLVNNAIYLRELAGQQIPKGEVLIQQLSERDASAAGYLSTLILLHINREQFDEAFAVAKQLAKRGEIENLSPAESLLIAGAYRLAGKRHKKAERNLEEKLNALLEIEKRVFTPWFTEAEAEDP